MNPFLICLALWTNEKQFPWTTWYADERPEQKAMVSSSINQARVDASRLCGAAGTPGALQKLAGGGQVPLQHIAEVDHAINLWSAGTRILQLF